MWTLKRERARARKREPERTRNKKPTILEDVHVYEHEHVRNLKVILLLGVASLP